MADKVAASSAAVTIKAPAPTLPKGVVPEGTLLKVVSIFIKAYSSEKQSDKHGVSGTKTKIDGQTIAGMMAADGYDADATADYYAGQPRKVAGKDGVEKWTNTISYPSKQVRCSLRFGGVLNPFWYLPEERDGGKAVGKAPAATMGLGAFLKALGK